MLMLRFLPMTWVFALGMGATQAVLADDQTGTAFFEQKIRPVLVAECYQCHSAEAAKTKKLKAELYLDSRAGVLAGGESGPAVVPGKVEDSVLISALRHDSFEMPPKGKLPDEVIANFVRWVEMGAPDPRDGKLQATNTTVDVEAGRKHWAFQPLGDFAPPEVSSQQRVRAPIDQFVLARQEAAGIQAAPQADQRTLLRRAYFDLVGLPPSPEDVEAFLSDTSPDAYEKLIDRLLASEHYGERWARHWLDLARFAESNGYAFDKDRANAHHYRDFVIQALNRDMPYDAFVRWQIAGDLLKPNDQDAVAASGFLVAGPFTTQQTAKERERSRYEQLDDMIHTVGTSLLGLTIGCARCHDHKFDPIGQEDYYRMIACLENVGFADAVIDLDPAGNRRREEEFAAEHRPLLEARDNHEKNELPELLTQWVADRGKKNEPSLKLSSWHVVGPFSAEANFDKSFDQAFPPETGGGQDIDLKQTYRDGQLKWQPQPDWADGEVHNPFTAQNSAWYLYRTVESPQAATVTFSLGRDDAIKLWAGGKQVLADKAPGAAGPDQNKVPVKLKRGENRVLLKIVNASGPGGFYFSAAGEAAAPADILAIADKPSERRSKKEQEKLFDWFRKQDAKWQELSKAIDDHNKQKPPPHEVKVFAAKYRGNTYRFGKDTYNVYYLVRGNADQKQQAAEPGFLRLLMRTDDGPKHWMPEVEGKTPTPSRVAFADWLTDSEMGAGQLLARVIVNRLWQHHFGRGIVATPSDFGHQGEPPTHPQLLDWLAGELIRGGWRLKPIHRLIMTSGVYRQGNTLVAANQKIDPENHLLWRVPPRRLEAEIIRDALLSVSGKLDATMYGPGKVDADYPRRSIYLTVKRSNLVPLLQLFDAPDAMQSIGERSTTTVAPQALAMMNSTFVRRAAEGLAGRLRGGDETSLEGAIDRAYRIALARPPSDEESQRALAFVRSQAPLRGGEDAALIDFCHTLLCFNEFVYVD